MSLKVKASTLKLYLDNQYRMWSLLMYIYVDVLILTESCILIWTYSLFVFSHKSFWKKHNILLVGFAVLQFFFTIKKIYCYIFVKIIWKNLGVTTKLAHFLKYLYQSGVSMGFRFVCSNKHKKIAFLDFLKSVILIALLYLDFF